MIRNNQGFSLIEVVIAMVLTGTVLLVSSQFIFPVLFPDPRVRNKLMWFRTCGLRWI